MNLKKGTINSVFGINKNKLKILTIIISKMHCKQYLLFFIIYIIYFMNLKSIFHFFIFPRLFWPIEKWTGFLVHF